MIKTTLKFQIVETKLGGLPRFVARVPNPHNYNQAAVVTKMMDLGTSVSRGEVESVLLLLQETVRRICSEGSTASLDGFVRFSPAVGGSFESGLDGFQAGRNPVYVNASVSSIFNEQFAKETTVEKTSSISRVPKLLLVDDFATETKNDKVTPQNIVTLSGESLKFDLEGEGEYLRFVNDKDSTQYVTISKFQKITDKELVFLLPSIPFPSGYFEVANAMNTTRVRLDKSKPVQVAA